MDDFSYEFNPNGELVIHVPKNNHDIIIPGRLSNDSSLFFTRDNAIRSCEDLSEELKERIINGITKASKQEGGPTIYFE